MKLKYSQDYLSITKFNDFELPKFTVLTGLNGVGKTHFLKSLTKGAVRIENVRHNEIVDFNNVTFALDIEPEISMFKVQEERKNMFDVIEKKLKTAINHHLNNLNPIMDQLISYCVDNNCSFYELIENDFKNLDHLELFKQYEYYLNYTKQLINNNNTGSYTTQELTRLLSFLKKPIEQLTRDELDNFHVPLKHKNNFLIVELGRIFTDYWKKIEENDYNSFRNEKYNESRTVFTNDEFEKVYGKKPWDIINEILQKFGNLEYKVNNPEGLERGHVFQLKLINTKDSNVVVEFENLSSGEKIMMALVSCIYKSIIDKKFPKLLLLDEIDASLHPSMSKILLDVIESQFVKNDNMNVVLVTHSPSTVAFAPENSIYVMNKNEEDRIIKSSKKDALNILTEGFASLTTDETDLKVSYNISKASDCVLLTEGITDRIILESAWVKLEQTDPNFDIQDCFDASFLRNLFSRKEIFANYPTKKFIAIFDFDKEGFDAWSSFKDYEIVENDPFKGLLKKSKKDNAYVMLLPVPDNDIKKQVVKNSTENFENNSHMPIELLFHEIPIVKSNFNIEQQVGGGSLIKFIGDKVTFATKIKNECTVEDLKNVKPIFETLKKIFID
ncbi:ATP-dependent nuclease [Flavobacterium tyrosinilyticum]|uniref:ATP-dependent nuclease n=1 Tax=Flavobacterium tyrosinilyticum TaxID=1658740 RepID=UPI00202EED93|nr:AAA family ATPase [Flavobacterium tyrosinilyticum]MCM0667432.1 ATP-binding protein [Flavobacterium tyrosinilyticum]